MLVHHVLRLAQRESARPCPPVDVAPLTARVKSLDRGTDRRSRHGADGAPADIRKGFDALLADHGGLEGPRVQDADRPAHIEALPQPAGARRPGVQVKPRRLVSRSERLDGIVRDR